LARAAARNAVAARNVSPFVGPDLAVATYEPAAAPPDNATNKAMSATTIAGEGLRSRRSPFMKSPPS
jgi:hypothetical protein